MNSSGMPSHYLLFGYRIERRTTSHANLPLDLKVELLGVHAMNASWPLMQSVFLVASPDVIVRLPLPPFL